MSFEDAFKSELGKEVLCLREENQELHKVVIRKQKELLRIRGSLVTEQCPECEMENTFEWKVAEKGYRAYCTNCGAPMMLCSECLVDSDFCDWHERIPFCHRIVEGLWKSFLDVSFIEDKDGNLILENRWELLFDNQESIIFPAGTDRKEIWHWFDKHHPKGIAYLLHRGKTQNVR